jgi:hypothetical protein
VHEQYRRVVESNRNKAFAAMEREAIIKNIKWPLFVFATALQLHMEQ